MEIKSKLCEATIARIRKISLRNMSLVERARLLRSRTQYAWAREWYDRFLERNDYENKMERSGR